MSDDLASKLQGFGIDPSREDDLIDGLMVIENAGLDIDWAAPKLIAHAQIDDDSVVPFAHKLVQIALVVQSTRR